jgi:hypothetical protein
MANYGGFGGLGTDVGSAEGQLNGTNSQATLYGQRTLRGSGNGTYDQGGPRTTEFTLKIEF